MTKEEIENKVNRVFWDYNIDLSPLFNYLENNTYTSEAERILIRMFENLFWYDLVKIVGIERIKELLTIEFINKIDKRFRIKFENIRKILYGEPISPSGWDTKDNSKRKPAFLSNRWYCSK